MTTTILNAGDDLNAAIVAATAGDTLRLHAGTYTGKTTCPDGHNVCFLVNKSLTIIAYGDGYPILTYDPNNVPHIDYGGGVYSYGDVVEVYQGINNVTFDGIEVVGMGALGAPPNVAGNVCIDFKDAGAGGANYVVRNCVLHDGNFGIYASGQGGLIELNHIYNQGKMNPDGRLHGLYLDGGGTGGDVRYNYIHHCTGYGLHAYSAPTNYRIYGNLITNCSYGALLTGDGHTFVNNTLCFNTGGGLTPFDGNRMGLKNSASNTTVKNNILWGNTLTVGTRNYGDLNFDSLIVGCVYANNLYNTVGSDGYSQASIDATDLRTDPKLKGGAGATTWLDLRLANDSPCRGAGISLTSPYNQALDPTYTLFPPHLVTRT